MNPVTTIPMTVETNPANHVITMSFEEVKAHLKQRFPFIMVDRVLELEPGKRIKTLKNVAGNEIQFLGHFPDYAIMPGTSMIEAIGQSASLLFSHTTGTGMNPKEFMALAAVNDMRFLVPVLPGHTMIMEVKIIKMTDEAALIEGVASVEDTIVTRGKLSFARITV
jgi:3-hydroxyacyl-[acyl-carrier-protein] dehydratase